MQLSKRQTQPVVTIKSSPTDWKKNSKKKIQVIANVCALLNTNGGELRITFPNQTYETKDLDQPVRIIEQWVHNLIGTVMMSKKVELKVAPHQILINIKGSENLITVNYNMFLPSHTQVNQVLPVETLEAIQDVLFGDEMMTGINELPAVQQVFVQGNEIKLIETYSIQFKQLKDAATKCTTLADRVAGNKLIQCVSAFANYRGGAIYFGVDDEQHQINGEVIRANERESIIKKVTNKINKMIWLGLQDGPRRSENWDIDFYPVVDKDGRPVQSTFVIVIVVARCPGGVFVEEPESYHIVNGYLEKMALSTWKNYLLSKRSHDKTENGQSTSAKSTSAKSTSAESTSAESTSAESTSAESTSAESTSAESTSAESTSALQIKCHCHVGCSQWRNVQSTSAESTSAESTSTLAIQCQLHVGRTQWSSIRNRKRSAKMNGVLIRMINDGSWEEFWARVDKEHANCSEVEISLVILLMKITANYKQGKFKKVQSGMEEYEEGLSKSKDTMISKTREFLLRSSVERCQGKIRESYEEARNGLALVEQIPAGIVVCNYYANIGTVITILLEQEDDMENKKALKEEATLFFQKALEHVDLANDYLPSKFDNKQKVHINLAFLYLGGSFASDATKSRVEDTAIEEAANSLNAVDKCVNEGYALSDFRGCQYLLARSVLFYRLAQNLEARESERRPQLLKSALKFSTEAREKATKCNFYEMVRCTSKHIDFFQSAIIAECMLDAQRHCQ